MVHWEYCIILHFTIENLFYIYLIGFITFLFADFGTSVGFGLLFVGFEAEPCCSLVLCSCAGVCCLLVLGFCAGVCCLLVLGSVGFGLFAGFEADSCCSLVLCSCVGVCCLLVLGSCAGVCCLLLLGSSAGVSAFSHQVHLIK